MLFDAKAAEALKAGDHLTVDESLRRRLSVSAA
jgi:hypothetical protein